MVNKTKGNHFEEQTTRGWALQSKNSHVRLDPGVKTYFHGLGSLRVDFITFIADKLFGL